MVFPKRAARQHMIFLVLSGKMLFFSEKHDIFFPWAESERRSFSENTWKHDAMHCPPAKKNKKPNI